MKNLSYLINGEFQAGVSPLDRGFAYGDGVFRTMRVKGGMPVVWHSHYQKLVSDCASIGIVCPSAALIMDDIHKLFIDDVLENKESVAKIIITRGVGERGYLTPAITTPLRVLLKAEMPKYINQNIKHGVTLRICDTRLARQKQLAGVKHLNRLENILARMEWRDESIFDGVLMDDLGHVVEGTACNIFARFGQELHTPLLDECGVSGVARAQIVALSKPLNLLVKELKFDLLHLMNADEVIISNSIYGAFQVVKIADKRWEKQTLAITLRKLMKYDQI